MSKQRSANLKELNSRIAELDVEIKANKDRINELNSSLKKQKQLRLNLAKEKELLSKTAVVVSEHALLRYIERAMQIDLDEFKSQILSEEINTLIDKLGNGKYPIGGGMKAVVKDRTIVTVV